MARQDSKARPSRPVPTRSAHRAAPSGGAVGKHEVMPSRAQAAAAADGNIAKDLAETSIAATQDLGHWMSHWQRLGTQAMSAWGGALGDIERDPSQAAYFSPWVFLPFELMQRQAQMFWSLFGFALPLQDTAGGPAPAPSKTGASATAAGGLGATTPPLWRKAWDSAAGGAATTDGSAAGSPDGASAQVLEQMARAQSEWLAMTQRWIDSAASLQLKGVD